MPASLIRSGDPFINMGHIRPCTQRGASTTKENLLRGFNSLLQVLIAGGWRRQAVQEAADISRGIVIRFWGEDFLLWRISKQHFQEFHGLHQLCLHQQVSHPLSPVKEGVLCYFKLNCEEMEIAAKKMKNLANIKMPRKMHVTIFSSIKKHVYSLVKPYSGPCR